MENRTSQRAVLALIAAALVLTALAATVAGVFTAFQQTEEAPAAASETAPAPDRAETPPRLADLPTDAGEEETPEGDPAEFIRFGVTEVPAKAAGAVRVATYNVENLFDAIDDPALSGRYEDIDDAKPEAHVAAVAETIRRLDADILTLQEIESEAVVRWFRESFIPDLGYEHLASVDAGDERGIEQTVLSRYPIVSVTNWPRRPLGGAHPEKWGDSENWNAGEPITFHRSPLRVVVEIPPAEGGEDSRAEPYQLTLYVVHAKSGRPGEYWRAAEARGLMELIEQDLAANPDANIAVLGDFNAFLSDESVSTYTAGGFRDALAAVHRRGSAFMTHESGRRIDHILVNDNLAAELLPESGFVLGTPSLPEGIDWRQEWRPPGYASDHFPVAVELVPKER